MIKVDVQIYREHCKNKDNNEQVNENEKTLIKEEVTETLHVTERIRLGVETLPKPGLTRFVSPL